MWCWPGFKKSIGSGSYTCINTQAAILNGMSQCAGANQSIKTINPDTGAVTCEPDDFGASGGSGLTAPGATVNYISKFTGASTLGNSQIQDTGDNIFIGSTSMPEAFWSDKLRIVGGVDIVAPSATDNWDLYYRLNNKVAIAYFSTAANTNLDINRDWNSAQGFHNDFNTVILWGSGIGINQAPNDVFEVATNNAPANRGITISGTSSTFGDIGLKIKNTGAGGIEWFIDSTNANSGYGGGKLALVAGQGGNVVQTLDSANGGRVGIGTTAPTEKLDVAGRVKGTELCIGADCRSAWPSGLSGAGTANRISKFTGATSVGDSQITDTGTNVGIGTSGPTEKLDVAGNIKASGTICGSNGCIGSSSLFHNTQCPVKRVLVDEISAGWDEWITYASCTLQNGVDDTFDSVLLTNPQICDAGTCRDIINGFGIARVCWEFGLTYVSLTTQVVASSTMCDPSGGNWACNQPSTTRVQTATCRKGSI